MTMASRKAEQQHPSHHAMLLAKAGHVFLHLQVVIPVAHITAVCFSLLLLLTQHAAVKRLPFPESAADRHRSLDCAYHAGIIRVLVSGPVAFLDQVLVAFSYTQKMRVAV